MRDDEESDDATRVAYRTCPLCEAGCGLEITLERRSGAERVTRIRGDRDDVFSKGYLCPKGSTLRQLHDDPARLRRPLVRRRGELVEVTWPEAWAAVEEGLNGVIGRYGREAIGVYVGNPNAHNLGPMLYNKALFRALGTRSIFTASTVDQRPKEISAGYMFGPGFIVPVPDIDCTDFLLMLGANPWESNGSFATAPDWPGRVQAIMDRGGEVVVVDPRRTRTAEAATRWLPIRPGCDGLLLAALVHVLFLENLVDLGTAAEHVNGVEDVCAAVASFTPELVAESTRIEADTIRALARRLAAAPSACVYGRIGTTSQIFGTLASWLIDVVNIVTGNLDRPGGAMFTKAAAGGTNGRPRPSNPRPFEIHRRRTRVRGLGETLGELPTIALAEEIDTPGDGQLRAFVCLAGNPVLSTPNARRLDAALRQLEFMVATDIYLNETTRHADVILPAPSALQKSHYDVGMLQVAVHNVANYSPAILPLDDDQPDEWEIVAKLALIAQGAGIGANPADLDDDAFRALTRHLSEDVIDSCVQRRGPERLLDVLLRTGPYELTLDDLIAHPHGIDLGPLEPSLPDVLRTTSGKVELAPPIILADLPRLLASVDNAVSGATDERPFLLVGRRDVRSNNSWMHNVDVLVRGKPRCTVQVHPDDAVRHGLADGTLATVGSRVGSVSAIVEITDSITSGVISLPHGWGHDVIGTRMHTARGFPGVNSNLLTDEERFEPISGNAVLNGIPVSVVDGAQHRTQR